MDLDTLFENGWDDSEGRRDYVFDVKGELNSDVAGCEILIWGVDGGADGGLVEVVGSLEEIGHRGTRVGDVVFVPAGHCVSVMLTRGNQERS